MPDQVATWRRNLPLLDPVSRRDLEQHVFHLTNTRLGHWQDALLLPPPPARLSEASLDLGQVVYKKKWGRFGLRQSELLQGLGVYGRSGAGKTNVVFKLISELQARGITFLFLDWKRTFRHFLPDLPGHVDVYTPGRSLAPFYFNPLLPPPDVEQTSHVTQLLDVLGDAYTLGDGAKSLLLDQILRLYENEAAVLTFGVLRSQMEERTVSGRELGWKASAMRALRSLELLEGGEQTESNQKRLVRRLLTRSAVLELDALNESAKKLVVPSLLQWVFQCRLQSRDRERLRLVVVIEEAHHLLYRSDGRTKESLMGQLLRQGRELGIGFVIVDQHPHLVSSAALGNTFASICLNLRDPADVNRAAAFSGLRTDEKPFLGRLPVGQGIVKLQDRWHRPFLVKFDHVPVKKGSVSDQELKRLLEERNTSTANADVEIPRVPCVADPGRPQIRGVPSVPRDEAGFPQGERLLRDCVKYPCDAVRGRYQRLGWSARRGGRIKDELVQAGLLEGSRIQVGRTSRLVLRPTRLGKKALGVKVGPRRESVEHWFWKHFWAERLRTQGYEVQVEAPRVGGRVDVLATRKGEKGQGESRRAERVAVEVETGKSDVVRNVKNCLRSGFDQVVVVATSEKALEKVERALVGADLLIPGRVRVWGGRR